MTSLLSGAAEAPVPPRPTMLAPDSAPVCDRVGQHLLATPVQDANVDRNPVRGRSDLSVIATQGAHVRTRRTPVRAPGGQLGAVTHEGDATAEHDPIHALGGQRIGVTLDRAAAAEHEPCSDGREASRNLSPLASAPRVPSDTINFIRIMHRKRDVLLRSEGDAVRRIKAKCRSAVGYDPSLTGGAKKAQEAAVKEAYDAATDKKRPELDGVALTVFLICETLVDAMALFRKGVLDAEREARTRMQQTHLAKFVEATRGFGWVGLMQIIGEAGDLWNYANPAKLWKRFGLGLIGSGERQRKFTEAAKALEAGYSPTRRSLMYVIGDSLIKPQGPYRDLYLQRLAIEHAKAIAEGLIPATTTASTVASWVERGLPALSKVSKLTKDHRGAGHMAQRAQRYVEKRLLRDLWRAWRCQVGDPPAA